MTSSFVSLLDREFLWPAKGDRLLRRADDWDKGASFSRDGQSRHAHIWNGYKKAGAALVEECSRNASSRRFLIYPILFCYRQGLELAMKWIVIHYGGCAGVSAEDIFHHDLWQLWRACKTVVLKVGLDGDTDDEDDLEVAEKIVKEFHDLDKTSLALRYPYDKNGIVPPLPDREIDLENVKKVMDAVLNFFTGADGQLDANVSAADYDY